MWREAVKTEQSNETIDHFLRELQHPYKKLTAWELDFLESVQDQFDRRGGLTEKQFEVLERIYAEKTA